MGYGQEVRIRHVTSGRYLAVTHDNGVVTVHRNKADENTSVFYLRQTKVRLNAARPVNIIFPSIWVLSCFHSVSSGNVYCQ